MKFKSLIVVLLLVGVTINSYAIGFPVKRAVVSITENVVATEDFENETSLTSPAAVAGDNLTTAVLLYVFLWPFAAHRWYVGKPAGWNILFILTLGGLGIWALVDFVNMITGKWDLR